MNPMANLHSRQRATLQFCPTLESFAPLLRSIIFNLAARTRRCCSLLRSQQDLVLTQSRITHINLPAAQKTQEAFHITEYNRSDHQTWKECSTIDHPRLCKFFSRNIALVLWLLDPSLFTKEMPSSKLVNMNFICVGTIKSVSPSRMNIVVYGAYSMDFTVNPGHKFCTRRGDYAGFWGWFLVSCWWLCLHAAVLIYEYKRLQVDEGHHARILVVGGHVMGRCVFYV